MTFSSPSKSKALAQAVMEGESPRDFLKRIGRPKPKDTTKPLGDYDLSYRGIDNAQYWQGAGVAFTDWDECFTGTGNNAHEASEDAINQAAEADWDVSRIVNEFPEDTTNDVTSYVAELAREQAVREVYRENYETDEEYEQDVNERAEELQEEGGWEDLQAYVVLYVKEATMEEPPVQEAEGEARAFFRKIKSEVPHNWPLINRWYDKGRTGVKSRRAYTMRPTIQGGQAKHRLRNTQFLKYPRPGEHAVRLHNTDVIYYDGEGNMTIRTGGWKTNTTKDRINRFLPKGWRLTQYQYGWYWWNGNWPAEIHNQLWGPRQRGTPRSKYWIPFNDGDSIDRSGKLTFQGGTATPTGELNRTVQEGRYMDQLAWIKRVKAKHEKMKEVRKAERDLEKLKEPKTPAWRKRWPIR